MRVGLTSSRMQVLLKEKLRAVPAPASPRIGGERQAKPSSRVIARLCKVLICRSDLTFTRRGSELALEACRREHPTMKLAICILRRQEWKCDSDARNEQREAFKLRNGGSQVMALGARFLRPFCLWQRESHAKCRTRGRVGKDRVLGLIGANCCHCDWNRIDLDGKARYRHGSTWFDTLRHLAWTIASSAVSILSTPNCEQRMLQ